MHKPRLPMLSPEDGEIVASLRRDGIAKTSLAKLGLPQSQEMFHSAEALGKTYAHRAGMGSGAFSDPYLVAATPAERLRHPSLFRWGLNQRLLHVVEVYLGLPAAYNGVNFFYTLADNTERGSRIWHRDGEDRRTVKIIVYLNDVDIDGGPFEVLHREIPGIKPLNSPLLTNEKLARLIGGSPHAGAITTCLGPTGTVIFAETARYYHRGRPAISRDRCALIYSYFSRPPRNPFYCEVSALSPAQIFQLTSDMTPYQRECALWRDSLPAIVGGR